ncbi:MAG: hypothetical protein H7Z37_12925, partial [Pyrinomonadaceae bacterium]|nr:hypothetical protein [Pyrinomonadaceae bacterium]
MIEPEQARNDLMMCAAFVAERIRSADGHAEAISDIARRFAIKGELDLAASLADTISDPHARDIALSEIAIICVDFDDTDYGLQLVEAIDEQGLQQFALSSIAIRQAKRGDVSGALQTASTAEDAAMIYGSIAVNLSATDELQAREIAERIEFPIIRTQFFNELAAQ